VIVVGAVIGVCLTLLVLEERERRRLARERWNRAYTIAREALEENAVLRARIRELEGEE
jgi:hypothetical protein